MEFDAKSIGRFVRIRQRADGTHRVFMSVPKHLRPQGWPPNIPIPESRKFYASLEDPFFLEQVRKDALRLNGILEKRREAEKSSALPGRRSVVELKALWEKSERHKNLSASRKYRNARNIDAIISWSATRGHPDFASIMQPDVEEFLSSYDDRPSTRLDMRSVWNVLGVMAVRAGWRPDNPAEGLNWTPPLPKEVRLWTTEDAASYADTARAMGQPGLAALIEVQMYLGQRLGDMRRAMHGVNYRNGQLKLRQSKTGARVSPPLPKQLRELIDSVQLPGSAYLFNDWDTGTIFNEYRLHQRFCEVRLAVMEKGGRGLELRALRHSAICRMVDAEVPLRQIAAVTGHQLGWTHAVVERYAIDREGFAAAAIRKLHKANGGSDDDFLPIQSGPDTDWASNNVTVKEYVVYDSERPWKHLAARLGQHRHHYRLPDSLVRWEDETAEPEQRKIKRRG